MKGKKTRWDDFFFLFFSFFFGGGGGEAVIKKKSNLLDSKHFHHQPPSPAPQKALIENVSLCNLYIGGQACLRLYPLPLNSFSNLVYITIRGLHRSSWTKTPPFLFPPLSPPFSTDVLSLLRISLLACLCLKASRG